MTIRLCTVFLLPLLLCFGFVSDDQPKQKKPPIKIQWTTVKGDFSFTKEWEYPIGVYRDERGQLVCDGWCPEGIENMRDSTGRIYPDSLSYYYALVDTTHQFRTLKAEAWCYEYAGANFIYAEEIAKNTVVCTTELNLSTHSKLVIEIKDNYCMPKIQYYSIFSPGEKTYYYNTGSIFIDQYLWKKGILKAKFDFTFDNPDEEQKFFWKGLIYTEISKIEIRK